VLTGRELQILAAVRDAKRNAQIGELLGISPLTVKNHLRKIMRKLNAGNRAQAVAEAMSRRLIA
jgi:DNA-binding CsgD family transcriptional regulator